MDILRQGPRISLDPEGRVSRAVHSYVNSVGYRREPVVHRSENKQRGCVASAVWKNFYYSPGSYIPSLSLSAFHSLLHLRRSVASSGNRYVKKKVRILFPGMLLFRAFSSTSRLYFHPETTLRRTYPYLASISHHRRRNSVSKLEDEGQRADG